MKKTKLLEHGTGKTKVVTPKELAELKKAPHFGKVYKDQGEASEEDVAKFNSEQRETGNEPAKGEQKVGKIAGPTETPLPNANVGSANPTPNAGGKKEVG